MNDEIKENVEPTLEYLKTCVEDDTLFETGNCKALLDYITNLQQENENFRKLKESYQLKKEFYESRIEKALRMLNHIGLVKGRQLTINEMSKLYSILQGDSNE